MGIKDRWDKAMKGKNDEQRTFIGYALISSVVFFVIVGFINTDNLVRWIKAGFDIKQQNKEIERYQAEIEQMEQKIKSLKECPDSLEHYAREQFGFCEPGEEVYIDRK